MADQAVREIRELRLQFREFIKENRWVPWIAVIAVLLSYGICLTGFRIGIDSEALLKNSEEQLNSWYTIGRFSLVFTKNVLGMRQFNPATENLLMMAMMVCYGIFADFLFWVFSGNSRKLKAFYAVFPALFLTHPCFVQQYLFTLQAFEVALGLLCCLIAVYCVSRWSFGGERWLLATGILFMVWGFGYYQALLPLYMAAALSVYLVYYEFHEIEAPADAAHGQNGESRQNKQNGKSRQNKQSKPDKAVSRAAFYWRAAVRHVLAFLAAFILYELAVKAVIIWQKGIGFEGGYLEEQMLWAANPAWVCIGHIKHYMREVLLGESVFYPKTFLVFAILFAVRLVYRFIRQRRKDYILYAAASLLLVLSPFYLAVYQGSGVLMRSQMSLPFAAAFFGAAAASYLGNAWNARRDRWGNKDTAKNRTGFGAAGVLTGICLLFAVYQGNVSSKAMFSAYMTYESDKMTAGQLAVRMQELGAGFPGQKVAMVGQHRPYLPEGAGIRSEVVGYSFFEWDYNSPLGVSKRGTGLLTALGYPCEPVSREEYALAQIYSAGMPSWPEEGSVQRLGDILIVKFSAAE